MTKFGKIMSKSKHFAIVYNFEQVAVFQAHIAFKRNCYGYRLES